MQFRKLFLFVLVFAALGFAQERTNTQYARQFESAGNTVADRVTAAQAACNANTLVPCYIVIDADMAVMTEGTMPSRCDQCTWMDYRTGTSALSLTTAGQGGFFGVYWSMPAAVNSGVITTGGGTVWCYQFVLPHGMRVRKVSTEVTTIGGAGTKYGVGLFDVNKSKIFETGALNANAVAVTTTTLAAAITLAPGVYWQCHTTDTATVATRVGLAPNALVGVINNSTARYGTAANVASSPGVLPATLGVISGSLSRAPVLAYFEP